MIAPISQEPVENYAKSIEYQQSYKEFQESHPNWIHTVYLEALRSTDYKRLDQLRQTYLDYTGGSIYGESQLNNHMDLLRHEVLGNPHSSNPTSHIATQLANQARNYVLEYFKASQDEYTVIFTQNATGALKLVGESYPFRPGSTFLLTFDSHNSVNGIREYAKEKGAEISHIPLTMPDLRIEPSVLDEYLNKTIKGANNLFAYPAQSNFSGVQHPLEWISKAQEKGWDVLLDSAAFTPTNKLDLSKWHPDFVDLSFYKMFGYPTGIGCLIVKHSALSKLKRPWFSGGTVELVSILGKGHYLATGYDGFEDGTINYLNLPAVTIGLKHLQAVSIEMIHARVMALTDWLISQLLSLRHSNGKSLIQLYGPATTYMRGAILAMNFYDDQETLFNPRYIEHEANKLNISLRAGCFCNPGSVETINGFTEEDFKKYFPSDHPVTFEEYSKDMEGKALGAIRVSLGIASNFADVYGFINFAKTFIDKKAEAHNRACCENAPSNHDCSC